MFYNFIKSLTWCLAKIFFRFKIEGHDYVPLKSPAILACNHQSFLDPPLVAISVKRKINFLARHDLFDVPVLGWLIRKLHAFPVKRTGEPDLGAFRNISRLLAKGEIVLLFPEGTRSRDGQLQKPLPGVGMIVYQNRVPVIPIYVKGSYEALPRGGKMIRSYPVKVKFGPPLDLEALYQKEKNKQTYQLISENIIAAITKIKNASSKKE